MSKKKWALLITLLIVAIGGFLFYRSYTAKPAPFDTNAEYLRIEKALVGEARDADAWDRFRDAAFAFERELHDEQFRLAESRGVDINAIALGVVLEPVDEGDDSVDLPSSEALASWYLDGPWPERFTALLQTPGLRAPSMTERGTPSIMSELDESLIKARTIAIAERVRLVRAIEADDTETALRCARNIDALVHMQGAQPCMLTMMLEISAWEQLHRTVRRALFQGAVEPELARGLIPIYTAWIENEPARTDAYFEAEMWCLRSTLELMYERGPVSIGGDLPPRILWHNQRELDRRLVGWFDECRALVQDGTAQQEPTHPWDDTSLSGRTRCAPLSYMLPATGRASSITHRTRCTRGLALLHLSLIVHEADSGTLPETLDGLVSAHILDALPNDPFAPDGAFRYRLDDDSPSGFLLYGVGNDHADDGGHHDPTQPLPQNFGAMPAGNDAVWLAGTTR